MNARLQRNLKVPPAPAFTALADVIAAISAQQDVWQGFALHIDLGDLHLPDVGYVAVPILVKAGKADGTTHAIELEFSAVKHPSSFPTFKGSVGIEATGPTGTILWLGGGYDVPLHIFGKFFDRTIAAGVADRTLENLIDDLAQAVVASVEKREAEFMRYHLYER